MMTKFCAPDKKKKDEEREQIRKEIEAEFRQKEAEKVEERKIKKLIARGPSHRKDRDETGAVRPRNDIEASDSDIEEHDNPDFPRWDDVANMRARQQPDPPGLRDTDEEEEVDNTDQQVAGAAAAAAVPPEEQDDEVHQVTVHV